MTAKTEAEAFVKLQEAATEGPWYRHPDAYSGCVVTSHKPNSPSDGKPDIALTEGYTESLQQDQNNADLFVAARNTALPRLTLEVVAENERLKRFASDLEAWAKNMRATRSPDNPIDRGYAFACDYVLGQLQALQEPPR